MLFLYRGGGSSQVEIVEEVDPKEWERLRASAIRILRAKWLETAAVTLESASFTLLRGTNDWGDAFLLLCSKVPISRYIELEETLKIDDNTRRTYSEVVKVLNDLLDSPDFIRFVVAKVDQGPAPVQPPSLTVSSQEVERALGDVEALLATVGAPSAIDRVHTAFHGYVRVACQLLQIPVQNNESMTSLFKKLRTNRVLINSAGVRADDVKQILMSLANAVDKINTIRNSASGAHPNELLLGEAEAMLIVNTTRTLLHYLDALLTPHPQEGTTLD